jgi:4-amino-4-deoxy-L-arabinose transferase-like glycosyltransferase
VLAASLSVLLTWMVGRRMFDARAAVLAAAFLCVAPMIVWDAHQARSDQLLLLTTIATMGALWRVYAGATRITRSATARERWLWPVAFWAALGLSVLAKGPITPMIALLAIAALCVAHRRVRWVLALRPIVGVLILGAVLAPWLLVIHREFGLAWYLSEAWRESFGRGIRGSSEGHFAPPGTHLVLSVALFWPGVMLALAGVARGLARGWPAMMGNAGTGARADVPAGRVARLLANVRSRRASRGAEVFLIAWLIPAWIVFEASMAKLPHYTMPLYPAAALLAARMVFAAQGRRGADAGAWIWLLTAGLPAVGLIAGALALLFFAPTMTMATTGVSAMIILCACAALAGMALALQFLRSRLYVQAHATGLVVAVLVLAPTLQWIAPSIVPGSLSSSIAIELRAAGWTPGDSIASEHAEDSMVFQTRGRVVRTGGGTLEYAREHLPHFIVARRAQGEAYAMLGYRAERDVLMPPGSTATEDRLAIFVLEKRPTTPVGTPTGGTP